jgi:small subunit ribosomal protein S2
MAVVDMKELLETGVHFGHRTRKWNPRMRPFIFTERNSIHIIDLQQTLEALEEAYALIRDTVSDGGAILFVGTKRQAQESIELEAARAGMPYVNSRWLGGTLTNWRTIRSRIDELDELERRREEGEFELLTKKEALTLERRIDKLEERLGGIRDMKSVPDLLFVVDVHREDTAVHEANLLDIPVIALVDTNCDPRGVDYVIPSNDDAIRAIKLLTQTIANAVVEGSELRKDRAPEAVPESAARAEVGDASMTDEELLGEATLAKLKTGEFDEKQLETEAPAEADADSQDEQPTADEPQAEAEPEPKAEADTQADAEAGTQADAEAETQADAEVETQVDAEAETQADAEAEAQADAEVEAQVDAEAETQADADAESQADAGQDSDEAEQTDDDQAQDTAEDSGSE